MPHSNQLLMQIDAALAFVFRPPSDPGTQRTQLIVLGRTARSLYERLIDSGCPVRLNLEGLELTAKSPDEPMFFESLGVCLSLVRHLCECPSCQKVAEQASESESGIPRSTASSPSP